MENDFGRLTIKVEITTKALTLVEHTKEQRQRYELFIMLDQMGLNSAEIAKFLNENGIVPPYSKKPYYTSKLVWSVVHKAKKRYNRRVEDTTVLTDVIYEEKV